MLPSVLISAAAEYCPEVMVTVEMPHFYQAEENKRSNESCIEICEKTR